MKKVILWGIIGAITVPVLFVVFTFVFGVLTRPVSMTVIDALRKVCASHVNAPFENLPILAPAGAIVGLMAGLVLSAKGTKDE